MLHFRIHVNGRPAVARLDRRYSICGLAMALFALCGEANANFSWVERPDPMEVHMLADADRSGDTVRVLYQSAPSLQQAASGDWSVNVFVAELHPDGRIDNRRLATGQRYFSSLVLQRGGELVFAVPTPEPGAAGVTLEAWSALDGSLRSSVSPPVLAGLGGSAWPIFPSDDGNLFTVAHSAGTARGDQATTLTWTKLSPEGEVLAKGEWRNPTARAILGGAFPVPGGGIGLTLNMSQIRGASAVQSDFAPALEFQIGGRNIEARVFAETRLLVADSSGALQWLSPALERDFLWDGELSIPQNLPLDQMVAQNAEQMALMTRVPLEHGGERRIVHRATEGYHDIQPTPAGYGMLARVTADRSLDPPLHGMWFIEVGHDGSLLRELRIEPAAGRLEAEFDRFLPTDDGGLLVAGVRHAGQAHLHLTALGPDGNIEWTAQLAAENVQLEGIAGTEAAPWAYGQGWNEAHEKNLLWAEFVDPASAQQLASEAPAPRHAIQPRPRAVPQPTAPPSLELPEPAEGCTCTCEEFAAIQELNQRLKSASQAETLAMISDPAFQARMNCSAGCAMQYAECR